MRGACKAAVTLQYSGPARQPQRTAYFCHARVMLHAVLESALSAVSDGTLHLRRHAEPSSHALS